jgi:hypothetical protein
MAQTMEGARHVPERCPRRKRFDIGTDAPPVHSIGAPHDLYASCVQQRMTARSPEHLRTLPASPHPIRRRGCYGIDAQITTSETDTGLARGDILTWAL